MNVDLIQSLPMRGSARTPNRKLRTVVVFFASALVVQTGANAARITMSLDGTWQVAESATLDAKPQAFPHTVPVPGLVDMAVPAFKQPGSTVAEADRRKHWLRPADPLREAFWYRRTVTLPDPIPPVARLKVHKALYGSTVWVNDHLVGEHTPNFTPGWYEVRRFLGPGENEIVIRVGASLAQVAPYRTDGWDNEKSRYIPGIYDSVELWLSDTPHIVNVQAVPDIRRRVFKLVVEVANAGAAAVSPRVSVTAREWQSRRGVAAAEARGRNLPSGEVGTVELDLAIPDGRLWSPEDPFLYEIEVTTGADTHTFRAGLREFTTRPDQEHVELNGRRYYLRGSNITIHRFLEDSQRAGLPWDREWVRRLHRSFKAFHWNSLRYCIGFPPEFWYDIADEEGILIQDEFPIWYQGKFPPDITVEHLAEEYTQWMRERWNHPCVIIWDAQNETQDDAVTRGAIGRVRELDLSRRPWDNGWGLPYAPGDITEYHPYPTGGWGRRGEPFSLRRFARDPLLPWNGPRKGDPVPPRIVNEYGWMWLNRDGTPTTLTAVGYNKTFGPDAHPDVRREFQNRTVAAETEFWRMRRRCAGVLHFCALGYSRPDGQTSDHFLDVANLIYEPHFLRYVVDAFAPVGLCVDFWDGEARPGTELAVPVQVTNDLETEWSGTMTLRLERQGRTIWEGRQPMRAAALGVARHVFNVPLPKEEGIVVLMAEIPRDQGRPVRSLRDIRLVGTATDRE